MCILCEMNKKNDDKLDASAASMTSQVIDHLDMPGIALHCTNMIATAASDAGEAEENVLLEAMTRVVSEAIFNTCRVLAPQIGMVTSTLRDLHEGLANMETLYSGSAVMEHVAPLLAQTRAFAEREVRAGTELLLQRGKDYGIEEALITGARPLSQIEPEQARHVGEHAIKLASTDERLRVMTAVFGAAMPDMAEQMGRRIIQLHAAAYAAAQQTGADYIKKGKHAPFGKAIAKQNFGGSDGQ